MPEPTKFVRIYTADFPRLDALRRKLQGRQERDMSIADTVREMLGAPAEVERLRDVLENIVHMSDDRDPWQLRDIAIDGLHEPAPTPEQGGER